MTKIVNVAWGLCAPMRPEHVLTQMEPYGVKVLGITMYANRFGSGAKVKVSDEQAAYAEYWACRCGLFSLPGKIHNPKNIEYAKKWQYVPIQRGCETHHEGSTVGYMPEPGKRAQKVTTRPASGGIMETLRDVFTGTQQMPIRVRRTERKAQRRQRRGTR